MSIQRPATYDLFKFKPISERLLDSLRKSSIWCPRPDGLNDPFDCQLDLKSSFSRALAKSTADQQERLRTILAQPAFFDDWATQFANIGVCSFTLDLYNALMWAHYAADHKGVCLLYRFSEKFIVNPANKIIGIDKVRYGSDTVTDWLMTAALDDLYQLRVKLTEIYLTAKAPDWSYEREVRIIRFSQGPFVLAPESLVQVCFGLRTPDEDIKRVKEAVSVRSLPVSYCQIVRDKDSDFGLTAIEI